MFASISIPNVRAWTFEHCLLEMKRTVLEYSDCILWGNLSNGDHTINMMFPSYLELLELANIFFNLILTFYVLFGYCSIHDRQKVPTVYYILVKSGLDLKP